MAEVGGALCIGGRVRGSEDLAGETGLVGSDNVLEDVALGDDLGTSVGLERVAGVVVPVVVDGVEETVMDPC